jgi:hypothetical protein
MSDKRYFKVQAYLDGEDRAAWERLMERERAGSQGDLLRTLMERAGGYADEPHGPTLIGWSEVRIAQAVAICGECDRPIMAGEPYRVADFDGPAPAPFLAHDRCTED